MKHYLALLLVFSFNYLLAQYPLILSQREQAKIIDEILDDRLRNTLPALMRIKEITVAHPRVAWRRRAAPAAQHQLAREGSTAGTDGATGAPR
jgi:hypothetical protein